MLKKLSIVLALLCVSENAVGTAVDDLNLIRRAAGLPELTHSAELQAAAASHARYLARYMQPGSGSQLSAHEQNVGLPEFTGRLVADRARYFDYPHSQVIENVSLGNQSLDESISSLMSAIYHRFAFLDMKIDEIGIAQMQQRYVYNMGRKKLARACILQPEEARIAPAHNCLGQNMKSSAYQDLCANLPLGARYSPPFPGRCANGVLLSDEFMRGVCAAPPKGAILKGVGRYYDACDNGLKISASWFDRACQSASPEVVYQHSGSSYQICTPQVSVHADWYQKFCANMPIEMQDTDSGTYYNLCTNGFQIKSEYFDELNSRDLESRPDAVIWPADGITDIQPVFYDEEPHPTPDLPMTGYPISVEFNSQTVKSVSIMGFTLEMKGDSATGAWKNVSEIRMIDKLTDINSKLTSHQFAWFPLQRLKWGTAYRYHIDALIDGKFKRFSAQFETTKLPVPVYDVSSGINQVMVKENHFILYREPDAYDNSPFEDVGLRYRGRPFVDIEVLDTNTVEMNVGGTNCAPVLLSTRLEEKIIIEFCRN